MARQDSQPTKDRAFDRACAASRGARGSDECVGADGAAAARSAEDQSSDAVEPNYGHVVQRDVFAFHRALNVPVSTSPAIRRPALRADLIREEAAETVQAIEASDLVAAIDGLCDLLCVTYGAAIEFGVDLAPFWSEVHRSNMAKAGGEKRSDGKVLKPVGWRPPDIVGLLRELEH